MAEEKTKKKEFQYRWEGKDKSGKLIKGEVRAIGDAVAATQLRRQGINVTRIKKSAVAEVRKLPRKISPCLRASLRS